MGTFRIQNGDPFGVTVRDGVRATVEALSRVSIEFLSEYMRLDFSG